MRFLSQILVGLGAFLVVAGVVYALTADEPSGAIHLLVSALTCFFLAVVARRVARSETEEETAVEAVEVYVGPTIWPLGFAVSGVLLALGLIVSPWILIAGGLAFATSAIGWLRAVARSHTPAQS